MTHPFPDDPNAEICAITGGPANARVYEHEGKRVITGWYGSVIADMTMFVVFDPSIPDGPICDEEIRKALDQGRIAYLEPYGEEQLAESPVEAIRALIDLGVTITEDALAENNPALPLDLENDPLAYPFITAVNGHSHAEDRINLVGMGQLLAMVSRLRGRPLVPGPERDAAVSQAAEQLLDNVPGRTPTT